MTNMLNRDAILATDDLERETVDVPEWGGAVVVQALTSRQRALFERRKSDEFDQVALVTRCVVDQNGNRTFGDQDIETLACKSAAAVDRLYQVAARLCGLSEGEG